MGGFVNTIIKNKFNNINQAILYFVKHNLFDSDIFINTTDKYDYNLLSQKQIFNLVKNMYLKKGRKIVYNNNQKIYITNEDIKECVAKILSNKLQKDYLNYHFAIFGYLDEIIENGILIARGNETKGRVKYKLWDYYVSMVYINECRYIIEFDTVLRSDEEKHFRLERIYNYEELINKKQIL